MSILPIITEEQALRQPAEAWVFSDDREDLSPSQLAVDLAETMIQHKGVGLAAPQIGIQKRVLAIKTQPVIVMFNPTVVNFSEQDAIEKEGCLSFPGLFVKVKRPLSIRVRFQKPDSTVETMQFNGVTARIVQHEIDHLDGILMWDRAHPIHKEQAFNQWKSFRRRQKNV